MTTRNGAGKRGKFKKQLPSEGKGWGGDDQRGDESQRKSFFLNLQSPVWESKETFLSSLQIEQGKVKAGKGKSENRERTIKGTGRIPGDESSERERQL